MAAVVGLELWVAGSSAVLAADLIVLADDELAARAEVVHRARRGQVAQMAPNVARPWSLIGRVGSRQGM
ncbi:MAG: hypothetical protein ACTMIR_14785 [Cellulomonadaceae bacterium]